MRHPHDHVGVVRSLRSCQLEDRRIDCVLYIEDQHARSPPGDDEVRADVSRSRYRAMRHAKAACADSDVNEAIQSVEVLLGPAGARILSEEPVHQGLAPRLPAPAP